MLHIRRQRNEATLLMESGKDGAASLLNRCSGCCDGFQLLVSEELADQILGKQSALGTFKGRVSGRERPTLGWDPSGIAHIQYQIDA